MTPFVTPGHQELLHLLALLPTLAVVGVAAVLPPHDAALEDHVGHLDGAAVACAAPRTCGGYTSLGPIQLEHRRAARAERGEACRALIFSQRASRAPPETKAGVGRARRRARRRGPW